MIHYTCPYIQVGWGLLRRGPRGSQPRGNGPEPQKPPARSNIKTCIVYHACTGPFWRTRQTILADAPIHFCRMRLSVLANVLFYSFMLLYYSSIHLCYGTQKLKKVSINYTMKVPCSSFLITLTLTFNLTFSLNLNLNRKL